MPASLLRTTTKTKPRCITMGSSPVTCRPPEHHPAGACHRLLVILGATGSGKTRLSLDLASALSAENINSDKMQLYKGLDITTNQIPVSRRRGVSHHLLGGLDPATELSAIAYRDAADSLISQISARGNLPILVGGSNSFIHALLSPTFDPTTNVFSHPHVPISPDLRYDCFFLWVDVSPPVLDQYLCRRVDDMMREGMLGELADFFNSGGSTALKKAIGVAEFSDYFRLLREGESEGRQQEEYDGAVRKVKDNTCVLARTQMGKIQRLRMAGWDLRRVDSTEILLGVMQRQDSGEAAAAAATDGLWEKMVLEPSIEVVKKWLLSSTSVVG